MKTVMIIHIISISIFLGLLIFQTILLLANKTESLESLKSKTKVPNMINSSVFLITGIYLISQIGMANVGGWFHLKLTLVFIGIPLGIIAIKKNKKALAVLTCLIYLYVYGISETKSATFRMNKKQIDNVIMDPMAENYDLVKHGQNVYLANCVICHGEDGKAKLMESSDLSISTLSIDSNIQVIKNGRKTMQSFANRLNEGEINAVANFLSTLKK